MGDGPGPAPQPAPASGRRLRRRPFRAEIVEDEGERQRLWQLADRVFREYADDRERAASAERVIPIVQLVAR